MLSSSMLQDISETLAKIAHGPELQQSPFGRIRVCLFADLGQLGPVDSERACNDFSQWIWNAHDFPLFHFHQLRMPCRQ